MRWHERLWRWLAWALPRDLAYWGAIRVMAYATMGRYGGTDPNELNVMEALKRWEDHP